VALRDQRRGAPQSLAGCPGQTKGREKVLAWRRVAPAAERCPLRSPRARVAGLSRECWRWPGLGGREWPPLLCIVTQAISCLEV
jgi:hypothetical protein